MDSGKSQLSRALASSFYLYGYSLQADWLASVGSLCPAGSHQSRPHRLGHSAGLLVHQLGHLQASRVSNFWLLLGGASWHSPPPFIQWC